MTEVDFQNTINKSGLTWWLDSGSLLGLVRDNRFLKQDHDIDIGILYENNTDIIEGFLKNFYNDFNIVRFEFNNTLYKCKCIPKNPSVFNYIFDFQFYILDKDKMICPQMVFKRNLTLFSRIRRNIIQMRKSNPDDFSSKSIKSLIKKIGTLALSKKYQIIKYGENSESLFDFYYWSIPFAYLKEQVEVKGYKAFSDYESYLAMRYGNWRIPVTHWVFTRDDKGLKKTNYKDLSCLYVLDGE